MRDRQATPPARVLSERFFVRFEACIQAKSVVVRRFWARLVQRIGLDASGGYGVSSAHKLYSRTDRGSDLCRSMHVCDRAP